MAIFDKMWKQLNENHSFYDTHIKRIKCKCGSMPRLLWRNTVKGFFRGGEGKFKCDCGIESKPHITSNGASCSWNETINQIN